MEPTDQATLTGLPRTGGRRSTNFALLEPGGGFVCDASDDITRQGGPPC